MTTIDTGSLRGDLEALVTMLLGAILAGPVLDGTYATVAELRGFLDTIMLPTLLGAPGSSRPPRPAHRRPSG